MNTVLSLLANALTAAVLPMIAVSATEVFAVLISLALLGFFALDLAGPPARRQKPTPA